MKFGQNKGFAEIATDDDRALAQYIDGVTATCLSLAKRAGDEPECAYERVNACMASIIVEFRNGTDCLKIGNDIWSHG